MSAKRVLSANYEFLGNVVKYQTEENGIRLYCEDNYQLNIIFYTANMFRVFMLRPQFQEAPLDYPIAKTEWEKVNLNVVENEADFVLSTDEITLVIKKQPCRLKVIDKSGFVISEDDEAMGIGWSGAETKCWKKITPDEKFFGLGEKTGDLNKRGKEWIMSNTDNPHHRNTTDPLYQSIPFFIGMREHKAYGIYFNNSYRSKFNLGASTSRYYSFSAEAGNMDYFFIYGPGVPKVVETYTELTGRTPMPPKWSLGYQQCRWSYYPDTEVLRIAETFREKKIPADVIYLDIHYMDEYRVFTWHPERFPDPKSLLTKLQEMGFKVVVIIDPGVKVDPNYKIAKEGLAGDYFVKYPDGEHYVGQVWPGDSYFPDFSKKEARDWWGAKYGELLDLGVDGFWNDMNEPAVWGNAFPEEVLFHDEGRISSQKKMHNLYAFLMAKASYDGLKKHRPDQRPFLITRAGFAGEQRFTAVWTGDNQATEEHLEMGLRMLQGMGLSGLPFVGSDVGGFIGTPSPELYARWVQSSIFTPYFRTHSEVNSRAQEPWSFGEEVEEIVKSAITRRYEILPYLYSLFWEAHQTGAPIMRPMFWHHQEDENVYNSAFQEQFYIGEKLLVAPVTRVGHRFKKIYLPDGDWYEMNTGKKYDGLQTIVVDVPLNEVPVFLNAGAIIPTIEAMQYVGEKEIEKLTLEIFPAGTSGRYDFYEDDGKSFEYEKGNYRLTNFSFEHKNGKLQFIKVRSHDKFKAADRTMELKFFDVKKPEYVKVDGSELTELKTDEGVSGYKYNSEISTLSIFFKDEAKEQKIIIHKI